MWVKICGVRTLEQAVHAWRCGADALGLNLHPPSPRAIPLEQATDLAQALRGLAAQEGRAPPELVAVLVNPQVDTLRAVVAALAPDRVQAHGDDGAVRALGLPALPVYTARPGVLERLEAQRPPRFLLDAWVPGLHGGTGRRVDLALAQQAAGLGQLILAGGLSARVLAELLPVFRPWGVDVASGVETSPGQQDPERVRAFVAAARAAPTR